MLALMEQAPLVASEAEAIIACKAVSRLKPLAEANRDIRVRIEEQVDVVVPIPARALKLIASLLELMAHRTAVSIVPHDREMTTKQAADLLNVSRPHLVGLIKGGAIPFRMVGTHRRLKAADVMAFRAEREAEGREAIAEMARLSQALDLD